MPTVNRVFPGSGVTPFTVWDLPFRWWMTYVSQSKQFMEAQRG